MLLTDAAQAAFRLALQHVPHDELTVDGEPYMRRYYLAGYAPPATCPRCDGHGSYSEWRILNSGVRRWESVTCALCDGDGTLQRSGWYRWPFGSVRLHEIVASDDGRAFHDHPWDFVSIGLRGGYLEERPAMVDVDQDGNPWSCSRPGGWRNQLRRFTAPWVLLRRAEDLHVLWLDAPVAWTLILLGPKRRTWGFCDPIGWMPWREFEERHPTRQATQSEVSR